jgi:hypothetical protein
MLKVAGQVLKAQADQEEQGEALEPVQTSTGLAGRIRVSRLGPNGLAARRSDVILARRGDRRAYPWGVLLDWSVG